MPLGRKRVAHGLEKGGPASSLPPSASSLPHPASSLPTPAPPTAAQSHPTPGCSGLRGQGLDVPEEDLAFPQSSEGK